MHTQVGAGALLKAAANSIAFSIAGLVSAKNSNGSKKPKLSRCSCAPVANVERLLIHPQISLINTDFPEMRFGWT